MAEFASRYEDARRSKRRNERRPEPAPDIHNHEDGSMYPKDNRNVNIFLRGETMSGNFRTSDTSDLQKLPQYTYVPGVSPHPFSDRDGHSFGQIKPPSTGEFRRGKQLFNNGYYWEAHEAWEAEWQAARSQPDRADFIKGLIKLAACGVKCLERNSAGAARHAARAAELFRLHAALANPAIDQKLLLELLAFATQLQNACPLATTEQQLASRRGGVILLGQLPDSL